MNLIIDIGNTRIKVAIFDNNTIAELKIFDVLKLSDIEALLYKFPEIDKCIFSCVGEKEESLVGSLKNNVSAFIELTGNIPLPFNNKYESKATQGSDRIAAIAGAQVIFPDSNVLIIDAGTTITFDFIDASGTYKGGNISPGVDARFKSLHTFTKKLPLLSKKEIKNLWGINTNQAIESGVQNGIVFEIGGYIELLQKYYKNLKTIITGGDAEFLANKIKSIIFAESNLVLIGLNRILEYNVNQ